MACLFFFCVYDIIANYLNRDSNVNVYSDCVSVPIERHYMNKFYSSNYLHLTDVGVQHHTIFFLRKHKKERERKCHTLQFSRGQLMSQC